MAAPGCDAAGAMTVAPEQFETVRRLIRDAIGLDLKPGKEALVAARLAKRLRLNGVGTIEEYLQQVKGDRSGEREAELIDDLTTNFTSFWREPSHFEFVRQHLAAVWAARQETFVWSAACSSGEEPYTLALVLDAALAERAGRVRIRASDISRRALERAEAGIYPTEKLRDLPADWTQRYFQKGDGRWTGHCRVKSFIRTRVAFERRNLMDPLDDVPACGVIFCRNVMIYFDRGTQEALVRRLAGRLEPGGYLFIGHSEGLMGMSHGLRYIAPAIYRREG
jgi:chemotaxis protein methyltransferase CheR